MTDQVVIKIGANATGAIAAFNALSRATMAFKATMIGAGVAVVAKATQIAFAFPTAIKKAIDDADKALVASQIAGMSVQDFSALSYAAGQAEVSIADLEIAARYLAKTHNVALLPALLQTADDFELITDEVERLRIVTERFGKGGTGLMPLILMGRGGIKDALREARQIGVVIDEDFAKRADKFNDSWDKLTKSMKGFAFDVAEIVLPVLQKLADALNSISGSIKSIVGGGGIKSFGRYAAALGKGLGSLFEDVDVEPIDSNAPFLSPLRYMSSPLAVLSAKLKKATGPMSDVIRDTALSSVLSTAIGAVVDSMSGFNGGATFKASASKARQRELQLSDQRMSSNWTSRGFIAFGEMQLINRTFSFQKSVLSTLGEIAGLQKTYLPRMAETLS